VTPPHGGSTSGDLGPDVELARTGDIAAFERIYRALSPSVSSYLRWNGARDVDSLTNQVMAQVHRNLGRFTGDGTKFRSWVFTIAHHRMVDDRRARGRRPAVTESEIERRGRRAGRPQRPAAARAARRAVTGPA
jgi:DNA-directed RNA polymerase specialized sigma24 family protein